MTLIWPDAEAGVVIDAPRLHAFIIGVGDYPHQGGGKGALALEPLVSQVTTPRLTAPAIAQWLLTSYTNAACPLGSIELLISPAAKVTVNAAQVDAEPATMGAIKAAFARWFGRCNQQANNIALFYFCGHGVARVNQYLLAQDFGNPAVPDQWENCIDFDAFRIGMRRCKAQTQLFFVDACREIPLGTLTTLTPQGAPLVSSSFTDTVNCSSAYYATTEGRPAFGADNDTTYFAKAVLRCLGGVAATSSFGTWVVDTFSLGSALGQTLEVMSRHHKLPLMCNPNVAGMARIHQPKGPRVLASLECRTEAANQAAEIILRSGGSTIQSAKGQPKPQLEEVDPGMWDIEVQFPGGEFPPFAGRENLIPPVYRGVPVP